MPYRGDNPHRRDKGRHELTHHDSHKTKKPYTRPQKKKVNPDILRVPNWEDLVLRNISQNSVSIITGATGCGKSTLIAPLLVKHHPDSRVLLIQPRRLATTRVAAYVAEQNGWTVGNEVGVMMGRRRQFGAHNQLIVATAGSSYNFLLHHPNFFDIVLVDEVHEMTADTECCIAILRHFLEGALTQQPNLNRFKLVLMSATILPSRFADLFAFTSVGQFVMGIRQSRHTITESVSRYKITGEALQQYLANPSAHQGEKFEKDMVDAVVKQVTLLLNTPAEHDNELQGDIIVFLPSLSQISTVRREVLHKSRRANVVILHSRLSSETKEAAAFEESPEGMRKVILCTNIAETSLTFPHATHVVDCCLSRKSKRMEDGSQALLTVPATQDAMLQRRGRVGRVQEGVYVAMMNSSTIRHLDQSARAELLDRPIYFSFLRLGSSPYVWQDPSTILTTSTVSKLSAKDVKITLDALTAHRVVTPDTQRLTRLGVFLSSVQRDMETSHLCWWFWALGIPYIGFSTLAVDSSGDCNPMLHYSEKPRNSVREDTLTRILLAEEVPKCFSDTKNLTPEDAMLDLVDIGDVPFTASGYSDTFARCRALCIWREAFPRATPFPNVKERKWCQARLLTPSGLRNAELQAISVRMHPAQELDIIRGVYPDPQARGSYTPTVTLMGKELRKRGHSACLRAVGLAYLLANAGGMWHMDAPPAVQQLRMRVLLRGNSKKAHKPNEEIVADLIEKLKTGVKGIAFYGDVEYMPIKHWVQDKPPKSGEKDETKKDVPIDRELFVDINVYFEDTPGDSGPDPVRVSGSNFNRWLNYLDDLKHAKRLRFNKYEATVHGNHTDRPVKYRLPFARPPTTQPQISQASSVKGFSFQANTVMAAFRSLYKPKRDQHTIHQAAVVNGAGLPGMLLAALLHHADSTLTPLPDRVVIDSEAFPGGPVSIPVPPEHAQYVETVFDHLATVCFHLNGLLSMFGGEGDGTPGLPTLAEHWEYLHMAAPKRARRPARAMQKAIARLLDLGLSTPAELMGPFKKEDLSPVTSDTESVSYLAYAVLPGMDIEKDEVAEEIHESDWRKHMDKAVIVPEM
eukprot:gnl/Dysnectes_brevis/632_a699_1108.p1 GENE.gnl/Dysnectes_brevis/632_a699_1108~~gnl/Dysnectes_brevis/632_a699_1108.p1  ORF type:complete len:1103 (+),score=459.26 gnl/Dysnectes_brevis/632_a699_1108:56-3310(+)